MLVNKSDDTSWQEVVKFMTKCPICNKNYEKETAQLVKRKGNANLVHITCSSCRGHFMAMVLHMGQGLSSVGMVTDLNFQDAHKLHAAKPITLDEILIGHEELNDKKILEILTLS